MSNLNDFIRCPCCANDIDADPRTIKRLEKEFAVHRAAQDLFRALKECLKLLDERYQQCATGSDFWKQYPAAQGNARAAIAKAEGKL